VRSSTPPLRRAIAIVVMAGQLGACTSWRVETLSPAEVIREQQPGAVRIERTDGHHEVWYQPEVHGDTLIVCWDHEGQSFLYTFDKRTGKERWKIARDEKTSWSTPLVVEHEGKPQIIISATKRVRSYDLATEYQGSYNRTIAHFVESLRDNTPFETAPQDNLETLRLVEDCYGLSGWEALR